MRKRSSASEQSKLLQQAVAVSYIFFFVLYLFSLTLVFHLIGRDIRIKFFVTVFFFSQYMIQFFHAEGAGLSCDTLAAPIVSLIQHYHLCDDFLSIVVYLRNRTAERRGRQNTCV